MQEILMQSKEVELLRQENKHYQELLSYLAAGVVRVSHLSDASYMHVMEINGEFTKMTGYTMEDIDNLFDGCYLNMVEESDRGSLSNALKEQLMDSNRYDITYRLRTKTGGFIWINETGRLYSDSTVRQSLLTDITALVWQKEQLLQSEQLFRITNIASGGAVYDFDFATGTYLHFENTERIYGVPAQKIISDTQWFNTLSPHKSLTAMIDYFYHPDDGNIVSEAFKHLETEKSIHYVARSKRADGTFLWTQVHITLIMDENGVPVRRVGHISDIDEFKRHTDEMSQSEQLFRITNNASGGAVFDYNFATGTYLHFENAESIYGVSAEKIISDTKWFGTLNKKKAMDAMISYFYHPDDAYIVAEAFELLMDKHTITYVARSRRADGSYIWSRVHIALIFDENGVPVRRVGHILDIDEMTKQMEILRNQAQEDPLTGIYNKTAAQTIVDAVLKKKDNELSALMVLDIDNFKGVNDTLGHIVGDAVLIDVCRKLKESFSEQTLGRVGGDEFIVFAMEMKNEDEVLHKAEQICRLFRETYVGPNQNYKISCSIGIAISDNENNFAELFKKADTALYCAKAKGKDCYSLYNSNQP